MPYKNKEAALKDDSVIGEIGGATVRGVVIKVDGEKIVVRRRGTFAATAKLRAQSGQLGPVFIETAEPAENFNLVYRKPTVPAGFEKTKARKK